MFHYRMEYEKGSDAHVKRKNNPENSVKFQEKFDLKLSCEKLPVLSKSTISASFVLIGLLAVVSALVIYTSIIVPAWRQYNDTSQSSTSVPFDSGLQAHLLHWCSTEIVLDVVVLLEVGCPLMSGEPQQTMRSRTDFVGRLIQCRSTTLHGLPVIIASSHVTDVEHVDPCKNKRAVADYLSDRYGIVPQQIVSISDGDTRDLIFNAFSTRFAHAAPAQWSRLLVVSSESQGELIRLVYDWTFALLPESLFTLWHVTLDDPVPSIMPSQSVVSQQQRYSMRASNFVSALMSNISTVTGLHTWLRERKHFYSN